MADLVGEDSHTQLQVEVVRKLFSFGEAGSAQEAFSGRAYSEAVPQWEEAGQLAQVLGLALGKVCQRSLQPVVLVWSGASSRKFLWQP